MLSLRALSSSQLPAEHQEAHWPSCFLVLCGNNPIHHVSTFLIAASGAQAGFNTAWEEKVPEAKFLIPPLTVLS